MMLIFGTIFTSLCILLKRCFFAYKAGGSNKRPGPPQGSSAHTSSLRADKRGRLSQEPRQCRKKEPHFIVVDRVFYHKPGHEVMKNEQHNVGDHGGDRGPHNPPRRDHEKVRGQY